MSYDYQDYSENKVYPTNAIPTKGNPRVLVIPIWFADSDTFINSSGKTTILEDIETAFDGTEKETGWHSVRTYYEVLSDYYLSLQFTFSDWYECGYFTSEVGNSSAITTTIVKEATEWYFENNPDEDRKDYDYNGDGYIDGIMTIYGAPDYSQRWGSSYSNLWAYCYWIQTIRPNKTNPVPNCFFWASYDFMYDVDTAYSKTGHPYGSGDCSYANIDTHTFIHESGHCLGFDNDYYDYSYTCSPAGGFSMQDINVGSHDPYSVMASGWTDPYIPTESCTIEIGAFQETRDLILLTPQWNDANSPFDEYLLLELYTPTGLNEFDSKHQYKGYYPLGPSETGIRLWHVDARLTTFINDNGGSYYASKELFNNPMEAENGSLLAMSNSYTSDHGSSLGSGYYNYNILQLIRNDEYATYNNGDYLEGDDLFGDGSYFSMEDYSNQFYNNGKLNSSLDLGWSFYVSISGRGSSATASVILYKE